MDQMGDIASGDATSASFRGVGHGSQWPLGHKSSRKGKTDTAKGVRVGDLGTSEWTKGEIVGSAVEGSFDRLAYVVSLNRLDQTPDTFRQLGVTVGANRYGDSKEVPTGNEIIVVNFHNGLQTSSQPVAYDCAPDMGPNGIAHMGNCQCRVDQHGTPQGIRANICSLL